MISKRAQIASAVVAALAWALLCVDAFTFAGWFDIPTATTHLLNAVASVATIGWIITIYRRPTEEVYRLGIEHGRRFQLEDTNRSTVLPIAFQRNRHVAIEQAAAAQAAVELAAEVALVDAFAAVDAMHADADN